MRGLGLAHADLTGEMTAVSNASSQPVCRSLPHEFAHQAGLVSGLVRPAEHLEHRLDWQEPGEHAGQQAPRRPAAPVVVRSSALVVDRSEGRAR